VIFDSARVFGLPPAEFREDSLLDSERLSAGSTELELIQAPGHSPDCICFYDRQEKVLICGDVLFAQNTGRVDLPGGNAADLKKSIEALARLEVDYLLPGHMDIVTGADEVRNNFDFIRENVLRWL
jgi:hydroxyacylglutathione hydrolase